MASQGGRRQLAVRSDRKNLSAPRPSDRYINERSTMAEENSPQSSAERELQRMKERPGAEEGFDHV